MTIRPRLPKTRLRCDFCFDDLATPAAACARCGALFHRSCGAWFARCATLGCGESLVPRPFTRARRGPRRRDALLSSQSAFAATTAAATLLGAYLCATSVTFIPCPRVAADAETVWSAPARPSRILPWWDEPGGERARPELPPPPASDDELWPPRGCVRFLPDEPYPELEAAGPPPPPSEAASPWWPRGGAPWHGSSASPWATPRGSPRRRSPSVCVR